MPFGFPVQGLKVKWPYSGWSVGGVLISLTKAANPWLVIPLLTVTRGQCDARPAVTFPAGAANKLILFGDTGAHICQ